MGNTERSKKFINEVLGALNPNYKKVSHDLIKVYRHGTVHAFAPGGRFDITLSDKSQHLRKEKGRVTVSIEHLLNDLLEGTKYFAKILHDGSASLLPGTLGALNKARKELG